MKGDFTRSTFTPEKHYSGVRMQQGRVALDADWNEQMDIAGHRIDTEASDVIGPCGAPMHSAGFALVPVGSGAMLQISPGRYYVDGILCENEHAINLDQQPDLPGFTLPTGVGFFIAYLDVWQRHITVLEDGSIREVALGGPDTATRTKTVWQVKLLALPTSLTSLTCQDEPDEWKQLLAAKTGRLSARAQDTPPEKNLCIVPPGAGFRRLENQLYRVEVHTAGALGTATFTWSRDNGSIVTRWLDKKDDDLIVSSLGRDQVLGFAADQWVELTDDRRELQGMPGTLVRLKNAEGQALTIDPATATGSVNLADFTINPKIRRWDSSGALTVERHAAVNDGFIKLEDGVEVKFEPGFYNVGDYWLIPARTTTGDVEWPKDHATPPQPVPLPPAGIDHHFCRLAIVQRTATGFTVREDCRHLFPPLTEVSALHYVSGDGQEVMPNVSNPAALVMLPQPLQVGVANRPGATVRFQITLGSGHLQGLGNSVDIFTDSTGIASCTWELDSGTQIQQVEAHLLSDAGNPLPLPVRFNANLSVARQVAYDPAKCSNLAGVTTVQDAIDRLCQQHGGCCVTVGQGGDYARLDEALNDLRKRSERDICLCLLHGEQELAEPLQIAPKFGEPDLHITIAGCGLGSRLVLHQPWQFSGVKAFTLRDVAIEAPLVMDHGTRTLAFDLCSEITLAACHITGFTAASRTENDASVEGGALLSITNADSIRLQDNKFEASLRTSLTPARQIFAAAGSDVLARLFSLPEQDNLRQAAFQQAARETAQTIAQLNLDQRKQLQQNIQRALSNTQAHPPLSQGEMLSYGKLFFALGATGPLDPQIVYDLLLDIRKAAIKAQPGTAIILEKAPQADERDPNLSQFIEALDEDDYTLIEGNEIIGILSLYGAPGPVVLDRILNNLRIRLKGPVGGPPRISIANGFLGTLQARSNQIVQVAVAQTIVQQIMAEAGDNNVRSFTFDVFGRCQLSDNVIEAGGNVVVCKHLTLAANEFTMVAQPNITGDQATNLGAMIADASVLMGNHGSEPRMTLSDISRVSQNVANLEMTIS